MYETATIEITTRIGCKNNCIYCPQNKLIEKYTQKSNIIDMSFDTFKTCVDKIPRRVRIDFSGMAEPWLNPDCTKMLLYANKKRFKIQVYTTCVGMTEKDLDLIKDISFDLFEVHLPDENRWIKIDINKAYLRLISDLQEKNIKNLRFMTIGKVREEVKKIIKRDIREDLPHSRGGNIRDVEIISPPPRKEGFITCGRFGYRLNNNVLLPNGDVLLCCMDYGMQHILGNILTSDYRSLFKNSEFYKLLKGMNNDKMDILCRYCESAKKVDTPYMARKGLICRINASLKKFLNIL
ncbi:MAG TPA: radical SAM protein [Candidatus Eremiobacteraeota bacterium]|nr:MAG: Radical SAM superfamily protein [bacterium ADurb.Bin363]HPZ07696.1 radical SAM protein [Candidatus Eremiobacteraeota bacterium]